MGINVSGVGPVWVFEKFRPLISFLFFFFTILHFFFCLSLSLSLSLSEPLWFQGPWTLSIHATQSLRHWRLKCVLISLGRKISMQCLSKHSHRVLHRVLRFIELSLHLPFIMYTFGMVILSRRLLVWDGI